MCVPSVSLGAPRATSLRTPPRPPASSRLEGGQQESPAATMASIVDARCGYASTEARGVPPLPAARPQGPRSALGAARETEDLWIIMRGGRLKQTSLFYEGEIEPPSKRQARSLETNTRVAETPRRPKRQSGPREAPVHTYIHTYLHTYIPTYLHTYIPTYLHTYIPTYIPTYLHTYIPTYLHTYLHTYIPTYLHTYIPTYLHTYIPTYMHTCIHTHIHTCIHACMHACIHTYIHTYIHVSTTLRLRGRGAQLGARLGADPRRIATKLLVKHAVYACCLCLLFISIIVISVIIMCISVIITIIVISIVCCIIICSLSMNKHV